MLPGGLSRWLMLIPLACGLIPLIVIHAAYAMSIAHGAAPACIPYLEGCVSVSGAARNPPAIFLFRASMIPLEVVIMAYWLLCRAWLLSLDDPRPRRVDAMAWTGLLGAAFLILYVTFLGTEGDLYQFLRRFGVTIFFGFTLIAQLLFTYRVLAARDRGGLASLPAWIWRWKYALVMVMLTGGLASIPIQHFFDLNPVENVIEWNFSLLLMLYFLFTAPAWHHTGFTVRATAGRGPP